MKNKIAIQMDDIKTIDFDFDSSFIIGLEGQRRNYDLFYYHPNDLFIDQGEVKAKGLGRSFNNFISSSKIKKIY